MSGMKEAVTTDKVVIKNNIIREAYEIVLSNKLEAIGQMNIGEIP